MPEKYGLSLCRMFIFSYGIFIRFITDTSACRQHFDIIAGQRELYILLYTVWFDVLIIIFYILNTTKYILQYMLIKTYQHQTYYMQSF